VRLALLAPELQRAILAGRQRQGLTLAALLDAPDPAALVRAAPLRAANERLSPPSWSRAPGSIALFSHEQAPIQA
jgi:hypothetical protein